MALLDRIAVVSGVGAGISLAAIALINAAQIISRLVGQQIPAADDFAAWTMAASAFLALPYALRRGDHIRVTLLLQFLPKAAERAMELLATAVGLGVASWAAYNAVIFVWGSYSYNEVAQGMLRVPLWIPQLAMPIGLVLLAVMLLDRLIRCLQGREPAEAAQAGEDGSPALTE